MYLTYVIFTSDMIHLTLSLRKSQRDNLTGNPFDICPFVYIISRHLYMCLSRSCFLKFHETERMALDKSENTRFIFTDILFNYQRTYTNTGYNTDFNLKTFIL